MASLEDLVLPGFSANTYGFSVRCVKGITTGTTYVEYTDGVDTFRKGVRSTKLVVDKTLTATGFSGIEDTDWENIKTST